MMNQKIKISTHYISLLSFLEIKEIGNSSCPNESDVEIWIKHIELMVFHNKSIEQQLVDHLKTKKEYLLFEPYPDIRSPKGTILENECHYFY